MSFKWMYNRCRFPRVWKWELWSELGLKSGLGWPNGEEKGRWRGETQTIWSTLEGQRNPGWMGEGSLGCLAEGATSNRKKLHVQSGDCIETVLCGVSTAGLKNNGLSRGWGLLGTCEWMPETPAGKPGPCTRHRCTVSESSKAGLLSFVFPESHPS